jgi:phenylalanyl-tRNA synthetase alpha chain
MQNRAGLYLCHMEALIQQAEDLKQQIEAFAPNGGDAAEDFRIRFLGTKGVIKNLMGEMKNVPGEQKKEFGQLMNQLKTLAEEKWELLKESTASVTTNASNNKTDITLPGNELTAGSRHPINIVRQQITSIFRRLGFSVADGPEIDDDWHNFTALNMPENHPARDMQDTFYIHQNPDWVLRTHTSNVQVREMEKGQLPIRIICPGRVYRNETVSARAHCFFHQVEGLYVAEMNYLVKKQKYVCARLISHLQNPAPKWISVALFAVEMVAAYVKKPVGWKFLVVAWYTPTCSKIVK